MLTKTSGNGNILKKQAHPGLQLGGLSATKGKRHDVTAYLHW